MAARRRCVSPALSEALTNWRQAIPIGSKHVHVRTGTVYIVNTHVVNEMSEEIWIAYSSLEKTVDSNIVWCRSAQQFTARFQRLSMMTQQEADWDKKKNSSEKK